MPTITRTAVALLSGGLDSSVALAMAQVDGWRIKLALTFDYGQRSASREIAQASALCRHFGVPHRALSLPWVAEWSNSALLSTDRELPKPTLAQLDSEDAHASAKAVWVPNRNGMFIEIAAGFAESLDADAVIVGFNREEASTFPDNSQGYMAAVTTALAYSTANSVELISPTATFDKVEIVRRAQELTFPFGLLWSCYQGGEKMCGECESCQRLKRAMRANGGKEIDAVFANAGL